MPTSVPGISSRRDSFRRGALGRGFTLLEMLVVVAIIGLFVGVAVLSTDFLNFERRLEQEANRLSTIVSFASDEALLQSQDFGVFICEDSYHFFIYNYEVEDWIPYAATPFEPRRFDNDVIVELRIDDRDVILETELDAFPIQTRMSEELTEDELDELPDPQIVILSSGEVTPFQLEFLREADQFEPGVFLNVAFDGKSEVVYSEF